MVMLNIRADIHPAMEKKIMTEEKIEPRNLLDKVYGLVMGAGVTGGAEQLAFQVASLGIPNPKIAFVVAVIPAAAAGVLTYMTSSRGFAQLRNEGPKLHI